MPDDKTKLDQTLQAFLDQQSEDKRHGYTVASLHVQFHDFIKKLNAHARELKEVKEREVALEERVEQAHDRLDAHRKAIVTHTRRLRGGTTSRESGGSEFDAEMDTGSFDIAAIQREVEEQKSKRMNSERIRVEETQWWKRTIILWVAGAFAFVATSTITILITLAILKSK